MEKGFVLWFTGLSGAGKSTLSKKVFEHIHNNDIKSELLDGDIVRQWITKDLGFSREDRQTNLERVTFVAKLLSRQGIAVVSAFISPYKEDRDFVRENVTNFIEIFVNAPIETCEKRDTKGLYKKARAGLIPRFTGVSDPYEKPENPDIILFTDKESIEESTQKVVNYLVENGFIEQHSVELSEENVIMSINS